jgi:hypothetical protein
VTSYEGSSLTEIEAVLDGLDEATSLEVFDATRGYAPRAIASVAASRADAAGGGGGGEWMGPFDITAANLPGSGDALVLFELEAGVVIFDAYLVVNQDFDAANIGLGIAERGQSGVTFGQLGAGTYSGSASALRLEDFYIGSNTPAGVFAPVVIVGPVDIVAYLDSGSLGTGESEAFFLVGS